MTIGITGGEGTIGKILQQKLKIEGFSVSSFNGDIRSTQNLQKWLQNKTIDALFHLAAIVPTSKVIGNLLEAYDVNVTGTINILKEINKSPNRPWFFYASTSHIYESKSSPLTESDNPNPISLYGETKYIAERICQKLYHSNLYNIDICCGRIFSFFHKTQKTPFLYPSIINRLKNENLDEPFFVYKGNSVRDFLNAEDVVEILIKLMKLKTTGTINIASGKSITIKDFVQNLTNKKLTFQTDHDSDYLVANIDKLNKILGR